MLVPTIFLLLIFSTEIQGASGGGQRVPSAVLNLQVEQLNSTAVRLIWERPAHENGHLMGYYIYKNKRVNGAEVGKLTRKTVIQDPNRLTTELIDLEPNTEYTFRVNAFNRLGDGEFADPIIHLTGGIPPKRPEISVLDLEGDREEPPLKVKLKWKIPLLNPLASSIQKYHVWYKPEDSGKYKKQIMDGSSNEVVLDGLLMGRQYEFSLAAENSEGLSENATERLATPTGNPDGEPLNIRYDTDTGKLRVSWEPPAEDRRNGDIVSYKASLTPMDSNAQRNEKTVQAPDRSVTFNVDPRRAYTFKVAAATQKGVGPYSPVLTINPDDNGLFKILTEPTTVGVFESAATRATTSMPYPEARAVNDFDGLSTADIMNAIIYRQPGPLDIPPLTSTSRIPTRVTWFSEEDDHLPPKPQSQMALVPPPTNVRVEAISNSSAVVQWDFEAGKEPVDGFVVRYIHEPSSQPDTARWTSRMVMSHATRHLVIPQLTSHKPYAFCILAVKNNRQGSCSEPPTLLAKVEPTYMITEFDFAWRTSTSVQLKWNYNGPTPVRFSFNHTGKREYFDQKLSLQTLRTPGFPKEVDGDVREYLMTNLRPAMQYTFHASVKTYDNTKTYWPQELTVMTGPAAPPHVESPAFMGQEPNGQVTVSLRPASEEYGPISHYWLIVLPGNFTKGNLMNLLEPQQLERNSNERKLAMARQISASPAKKMRRSAVSDADTQTEPWDTRLELVSTTTEPVNSIRHRRSKSDVPTVPYITARINSEHMRKIFQQNLPFVIGDEKNYHGFTNFPLEPNSKYSVMMRAFAKEDKNPDFNKRAPMSVHGERLWSDSQQSPQFSTGRAARSVAGSGVWLVGPLIALLIVCLLIAMLVCWWMRCNKKSAGRGHRHGSITKVALGGPMVNGGGAGPGETSKLLTSDSYGRTVMNPYEQMNGNCVESSLDLYPMPQTRNSAGSGGANYAPVPVPLPCLPASGGVVGGHTLSHPAIPIAELTMHIERLRTNNNAGFQQEFESIETGQHFTWDHSNTEYNKHKNRYANVVAYDHSRVILSSLDGMPGTDYINANYIDGYDKPKSYIATQGPLPETFADFWRMIWEEASFTIVMLTNLEERNRVKCDQYWPSRGTSTYGDVQVTLLETTVLAHYTMRVFRIQMLGDQEMREIRHLQYTAWPDHGVPDHPTPFLIFLKRVKTLNPHDAGPITSHCSAGIGRTGAFIVIDCMLERLRYENTVDIFGCVTALRSQRSYMVQTEEQYVFIHDAVLDAVNSGSTEVPAGKLHQHLMQLRPEAPHGISGIEMEFRHLSTLKWANTRCAVANLPVNRHKNRQLSCVPFDSNRVILRAIPGIDGSDYINASWVDGYRERGAYIATQDPLEQTYLDMWRMVWEQQSAIIVMLTGPLELNRGECIEYWPLESAAQVGQLVVEPIAEYNMQQYVLREFRISDVQSGMSRTVRHFQFNEWPEYGAPTNAENFVDFIHQVHRTKCQFGVEGPITVHCGSGAGRTGAFIALAILMDRMRLEHVVDVFTTVKLLRTERAQMVQEKEQYEFLYQACHEYLATYDQFSSA